MGAVDIPDPEKVKTVDDLLTFVHYYHGTPRGKNAKIGFYKAFDKFLEKYPEWQGRIAYQHLAKVCAWMVQNRKGRVKAASFLLYRVEDMVKIGALPELEEKTEKESLEDQFYSILLIEDDPMWRSYLISTQGKLREQAITEWRQERAK